MMNVRSIPEAGCTSPALFFLVLMSLFWPKTSASHISGIHWWLVNLDVSIAICCLLTFALKFIGHTHTYLFVERVKLLSSLSNCPHYSSPHIQISMSLPLHMFWKTHDSILFEESPSHFISSAFLTPLKFPVWLYVWLGRPSLIKLSLWFCA